MLYFTKITFFTNFDSSRTWVWHFYRPEVHVCDVTLLCRSWSLSWIGLYKSASNNSYYWLDGNNSTYRNWYDGDPGSNPRQCVLINNDGQFIDQDCTGGRYIYRFVCKGIYLL